VCARTSFAGQASELFNGTTVRRGEVKLIPHDVGIRTGAVEILRDGTFRLQSGPVTNDDQSCFIFNEIYIEGGVRAPLGSIDVTNNRTIINTDDFYWRSPSAGDVRSLLASGLRSGKGIVSTFSDLEFGIGYATMARLNESGIFCGADSIVLKLSRIGDANLDGTVNAADVSVVRAAFGQHDTDWLSGDFDYTGTIDTVDFNVVAARIASPHVERIGAPVPEPTCTTALGLGAMILFRRRRSVA